MTAVTDRWVAEQAEKIFAHSPAYNADIEMAGREDALRGLRGILQVESGPRSAVISDMLGAGKTFFLQHAFSAFTEEKLFDEERDVATIDYRDATRKDFLGTVKARILIVEELDRKTELEPIESAVEAVARWLDENRSVILTGDFALRNPELLAAFAPKGGVRSVEMEPLDNRLLKRALYLRVYKGLRQKGLSDEDAHTQAGAGVDDMIAPELLAALLPRTEPPVATFREILRILQEMAKYLPLDTTQCRFSPDIYLEWSEREGRTRRRRGKTAEFVVQLHDEIRRRLEVGEPWRPLHLAEWPWLTRLTPEEQATYETEVMDVLVREKVLLPMGIPYAPPARRRTPGPYVPTVLTFLAAIFGGES